MRGQRWSGLLVGALVTTAVAVTGAVGSGGAAALAQSPLPLSSVYVPPGGPYPPDLTWSVPLGAAPREVVLQPDDAPLVVQAEGQLGGPITLIQHEADGSVRWEVPASNRGYVVAAAPAPDGGTHLLVDPGGTTPTLTFGDAPDAVALPAAEAGLARFDDEGVLDWAIPIEGNDAGLDLTDLTVDGAGNTVISGATVNAVTVGSGPGAGTVDRGPGFLASVAPDGSVRWARRSAHLVSIVASPGAIWGASDVALLAYGPLGQQRSSQRLPSGEHHVTRTTTGAIVVAGPAPTEVGVRLGPFAVPNAGYVARFRPTVGWEWLRRLSAPIPPPEFGTPLGGNATEIVPGPDDTVVVAAASVGGILAFDAQGRRPWSIPGPSAVLGLAQRGQEIYAAVDSPLLGDGPFRVANAAGVGALARFDLPTRIPVTTTADLVAADDGQTSLREAVIAASAPGRHVVDLPAGRTYSLALCGADDTGSAGDLDVDDPTDATYVEGHGSTIRQTCDGERLLDSHGEAPLVLRDLELRNGSVSALDPNAARGGAVRGADAVWLYRADVMDSSVSGPAAAGGGVYGDDVFVSRSTVARNEVSGVGARGGGVAAADDVVLVVSTLSGNDAVGVGAVGGGASSGPEVDGQAWRWASTTVYDNAAPRGANLHLAGDPQQFQLLAVGGPRGGGENCAFDAPADLTVPGNVEDGSSCGFEENLSGSPLLVEALADNGGSGLTHYPQRGSPLLTTNDSTVSRDRDQRGIFFSTRDGYDRGSVEPLRLEPDAMDVDASWGHEVLVRWLPPEDDGGHPVTGYRLFRDGTEIGSFGAARRSYLDTDVTAGEEPVYSVVAENLLGPGLPGMADATVLPRHPWSDLPGGRLSWAADWLAHFDLYQGFADGTFRRRAPMTRAQVVRLLWTAFDEPAPSGPSEVTDVPADARYRAAVDWAVQQEWVELDDRGRFRPSARATRREAVAMAWSATGEERISRPLPGYWVDAPGNDLALRWAYRYEMLPGYPGNRFRPTQAITRGQLAVLLYRVFENGAAWRHLPSDPYPALMFDT